MVSRRTYAARIAFIAGLLALALALVPAAFAGRGGTQGGGKPGGGGSTSGTLHVSCNPCPVGSYAQFSGSGYDPSQGAQLWITNGFVSAVAVASDGSVSFSWYMSAAGKYDVRLYQRGNGGKLALKGEVITYAS